MVRSILNADASLIPGTGKFEEGDGIDLTYGNLDSGRNFWTVVLLLATRDNATSVQFRPSMGEDCLSLTVARVDYSLFPPDPEVLDWLLRVGCNLSAGSA
jgi:hypothetical protein